MKPQQSNTPDFRFSVDSITLASDFHAQQKLDGNLPRNRVINYQALHPFGRCPGSN
jgi:hypothetical protein